MKTILKRIQSSSKPQAIYKIVIEEACTWALCGFVAQANLILEKAWSLGLRPDGNTKYAEGALKMLWQESGHFPKDIPIAIDSIASIIKENWGRHFWPHWQNQTYDQPNIKGKDWTNLSGQDLRLYAIALAYDQDKEDQVAEHDRLMTSVQAIEKYLNEKKAVGHDLMSTLICGVILTARLGQTQKAQTFLLDWAEAFKKYWMNSSPAWLMRDQKVAQILVTGLLAPAFQLDAQLCEQKAHEINRALEDRLGKGQSLAFEQTSLEVLIDQLIQLASQSEYFELPTGITPSTFQQKLPPAKPEDVERTENRLEIKLPPSYLHFLKVTNGLPAYSSTTPSLHSVQQIDWFKSLAPETVESWVKSLEEFEPETAEGLSRSLLIGGYREEQQLLLIPNDAEEEWQCWFFANWNLGPTKYNSFRYYLEEELMSFQDDQQ